MEAKEQIVWLIELFDKIIELNNSFNRKLTVT